MQNPAVDFDVIVQQFTSGRAWWQLGVVVAGFALSWILARLIRAKLPADLSPGALKIGAGSVHRLVVPLLALIFVWWGAFALSKWQPVPLLRIAIPMIASYAVIRLVIYLLRHVIPPSEALKASERIIAYSVWMIVALYLTGVLPEIAAALEDISFRVGNKSINLLQIIHAIFWSVFTVFSSLAISRIIEQRLMATTSMDMSIRVFAGKIIRALAVVIAILVSLSLVGIDITVLSVFGGALGVGLGLGLQKIASNYVSGFVILLDRSIRPGDIVTIGDRQGVVADIKARYTVLRGADGTEAIIPNDSIISNTVLNHTYSDTKSTVKTGVTVAYECDIKQAMALLLSAGQAQPRVLQDPPPAVMVRGLADNGIDLELTTWIKDPELGQGALRSDILLAAWQAFREHGIGVPYPQREIRIVGGPAAGVSPAIPAEQ